MPTKSIARPSRYINFGFARCVSCADRRNFRRLLLLEQSIDAEIGAERNADLRVRQTAGRRIKDASSRTTHLLATPCRLFPAARKSAISTTRAKSSKNCQPSTGCSTSSPEPKARTITVSSASRTQTYWRHSASTPPRLLAATRSTRFAQKDRRTRPPNSSLAAKTPEKSDRSYQNKILQLRDKLYQYITLVRAFRCAAT